MAEHDTERVDAEKAARRSKKSLPLGDQKKAAAEPDANQLRQGTQTAGAEAILGLQQSYGNAYVQRLLKSRTVQPKLTVNPPDDQYEREADQVADAIAQAPVSQVQRQAEEEEEEKVQTKAVDSRIPQAIQLQAEEEEEKLQTKLQREAAPEEEEVQTRATASAVPEVSPTLEDRINAARGSGQALPDSVRSSIEPALGHDFSQVRLHTDAEADGLSRQLGAKSFTTGEDVFFRDGNYQPDTQEGRGLIGHELTHVAQQGQGKTDVSPDRSIQQMTLGTGAPPATGDPTYNFKRVTKAEEDRVKEAIDMVDNTLGQDPALKAWFKQKSTSGDKNAFSKTSKATKVWRVYPKGCLGLSLGDGNIGYDITSYVTSKYFLAGSLIHELGHEAKFAKEEDCEEAVEKSKAFAPMITAVSPNTGTANDEIEITGYGLGIAQEKHDKVIIGGQEATVVSWQYEDVPAFHGVKIKAKVPAGLKAGSSNVVIVNNKIRSGPFPFTVL